MGLNDKNNSQVLDINNHSKNNTNNLKQTEFTKIKFDRFILHSPQISSQNLLPLNKNKNIIKSVKNLLPI